MLMIINIVLLKILKQVLHIKQKKSFSDLSLKTGRNDKFTFLGFLLIAIKLFLINYKMILLN